VIAERGSGAVLADPDRLPRVLRVDAVEVAHQHIDLRSPIKAIGLHEVRLRPHPEVEFVEHVHHAGNSSGIVDGADHSGLANGVAIGLYDIATHSTYPGFHSMPADHLAINKEKWDALPPDI